MIARRRSTGGLGGKHIDFLAAALDRLDEARSEAAAADGSDNKIEIQPESEQLFGQARVALDHERVVIWAGDISVGKLLRQFVKSLEPAFLFYVDEVNLSTVLPHGVDFDFRCGGGHDDGAALSEKRAGVCHCLAEIA